MSLGEQIRNHRIACHLTQGELAHACFVTRQTISNWESGKTLPDIQSLQYLASALDTTIDELVDGATGEIKTHTSPDRREVLLLYLFSFFTSLIRALIVLGVNDQTHAGMINMINLTCTLGLTFMFARIAQLERAHSISTIEEIAAYILGYKNVRQLPKKGALRFIIHHWYGIWFSIVIGLYIVVECAR